MSQYIDGVHYSTGYLLAGGQTHHPPLSESVSLLLRLQEAPHDPHKGRPLKWIAEVEREWTEMRRQIANLQGEVVLLRRDQQERYDDLRTRTG